LEVQNLLDSGLGEYVMVALDPLIKSKVRENRHEVLKPNVGIRRSTKQPIDELIPTRHGGANSSIVALPGAAMPRPVKA
jgi:hypothetical protein